MFSMLLYFVQVVREFLGGHLAIPSQFQGSEGNLLGQFKVACRQARRWGWVQFQLVTDYPADDPADSKVRNALSAFWGLPCGFNSICVPPLDTAACGFTALVQLVAPSSHLPKWLVGFLNVAPIAKADRRNGGHKFYAVLLKNGLVVFSPNAGHSLSYLKPYAVAFAELDFEGEAVQPPNKLDVQFRSWWWFPQAVTRFLRGDFSKVVAVTFAAEADFIEEVPESLQADVDGFGNIRLRISAKDVEDLGCADGTVLDVLVDGEIVGAGVYGSNKFGLNGDTLSLKPGSNIVQIPGEPAQQFLDFFLVGRDAHEVVGNPGFRNRLAIRVREEQPTHLDAAIGAESAV